MQISSHILFANDEGEGEVPIVFLHSLAGNNYQWINQISHLKSNYRTIAVDWRGHGNSITNSDDFNFHHLADDLEATFNQLNVKKCLLVGHSAGASLALAYAENYPKKVAGILLADPSGDARMIPAGQANEFMSLLESDAYEKVIEKYWLDILDNSKESTKEHVINDLRSTNKKTVLGVFKALMEFNPMPALQTYKGKVFSVITSQNKQPFSLQNIYPKLDFVEIKGTSHWLQLDKPEEFNKIMDEFLTEVEKS